MFILFDFLNILGLIQIHYLFLLLWYLKILHTIMQIFTFFINDSILTYLLVILLKPFI